jgi:hypothetical protein
MLRRPEDVAKLRGISVREVLGVGPKVNGEPVTSSSASAEPDGAGDGGPAQVEGEPVEQPPETPVGPEPGESEGEGKQAEGEEAKGG